MFEDDPGFMPDYNAPINLGEQFRALQNLGSQAVNFVGGAVRMVPGFLSDVRESFRPENQLPAKPVAADLPRALERAENIASEQVATVTENILGRVGVPESVSTPIAGLTGALLTPGIGDIKMLSMPLVGMVSTNGSMRLAARRGRRGDFLPQEQYDAVRPERINAVRDKRDELKEVIQTIEENNPGVKKGVLAATNKEYKRAKENVEDLEALLSSEESNILAPKPGNEWAYPPPQPRAKEIKAAENDLRGTVEAFELHHLVPKGISAAMMNRVRDFIEKGDATVEDLKRFATRPTELGLPDIGDLETNLSPMSRVPHNRFHTEMRYQGSYQFPGQKLEISKQNLASELAKIKNFKDLERLWDEMLKGDVKYLVETAGTWEKMDEALKSVSPAYTGTALYKPKK
jgi:hypothetical protein